MAPVLGQVLRNDDKLFDRRNLVNTYRMHAYRFLYQNMNIPFYI